MLRSTLSIGLCLALMLFAVHGCSSGDTPVDAGVEQAGGDGGPTEGKAPGSCKSVLECPKQDCVNGKCVPTGECMDHKDCGKGRRCFEDRCVTICGVDIDCASGYVCADGNCHKLSLAKGGTRPNEGSTTNKPLKAGLAIGVLDFPLGVSMAGYGFRKGPKTRYARAMGGSNGLHTGFNIKVLVLDDGVERVAIVRLPIGWTTDLLVARISQAVVDKAGVNLFGKILISSTHTHSGPARFWNLLPNLGFGAFGGGHWHPEVFRRLVASISDTIIQANKALEPAKLGYKIDEDWDKQDRVFSDRRSETSKYKNPQLLVVRVDKADGTPMAVLVNFGMHGTIHSGSIMTDDAPGGIEWQLQEHLEASGKKRVEAFFINGSGGGCSPRGDHLGHGEWKQMEMVGRNAAPMLAAVYDSIQTKSDITMEMVHRRIPLSRKHIGYKEGEFYREYKGEIFPFNYGAFKCVEKGFDWDKDKTGRWQDGNYKCIFAVEDLHGAPVPQFSKTHLAALRIGSLYLTTIPGEPLMEMARHIREQLRSQSGGKIKDHALVGFSMDHQLYVMLPDNWLRGGYEPSMSIWGPKGGAYIAAESIKLGLQLTTKEKESNDNGMLPADFHKLDLSHSEKRETTPEAGKMVTQPPRTVRRFQVIKFSFRGGFFGVDRPKVVLEREKGGSFEVVTNSAGRPYDDMDHRLFLRFTTEVPYTYTYTFEEHAAFPAGTYRFSYKGFKWDGSKRVAYAGSTDSFDLAPATDLRFYDVSVSSQKLSLTVTYPAGTNDDGTSKFSGLAESSHRLRSSLVPWQVGGPLADGSTVQVKLVATKVADGTTSNSGGAVKVKRSTGKLAIVISREADGTEKLRTYSNLPLSKIEHAISPKLAPGKYKIKVTVTDSHGNTGTSRELEVTVK